MRIGTDIIEVKRVKKLIEMKENRKERLFTPEEIEYCESRKKGKYQSYAGMYAAKEAFLKALGTGLRQGSWVDISLHHDLLGSPVITLQGVFEEVYMAKGYEEILVSISHCKDYAVSTVILR